tara:strand:- start:34662 stop:36182 length:1521 start_codon:yes stop_codon:yes gene_type:complete
MSNAEVFKQLEAVKAYKRLREDNGILFYDPHPKQDAFHRAGESDLRYVRTGNRFGKSHLGAAEDCAWALGERPWYAKDDPARYAGIPQKSNKILVLCQDWDKVHEIFTNQDKGQAQGKIFFMLPEGALYEKPKKSKNGVVAEVKVKSIHGGISTIYFDTVRSFMANSMGQESSDWDAIHVDEPLPKEMWVANSRGLMDRDGKAWFTCTPISHGWINDMFVPRRRFREDPTKPIISLENGLSKWMVTGKTSDNPHLTAKAIAKFEMSLTEAQKQCRLNGIPLSLEGIIYKEFTYDKHVFKGCPKGWEASNRPPTDYTIRVAIDPHPETPHAVLCVATSPLGQSFFFEEIFEHCNGDTLCERINLTLIGYEPLIYLMDPAGFIEYHDGTSMADVFDEEGIFVTKAPKDLQRGIIETKLALAKKLLTPLGNEYPVLMFASHLEETLWEFDHYEWNPKRPNKPIDKDDHMLENLYRLVITGLDYVAPEDSALSVEFDGNYSTERKFYANN